MNPKQKRPTRARADAVKPFRCKNLIAIIEDLQNTRNSGAVIRNVNALGVEGLWLRYVIRRQFAPYLGVEYSRAFGRTRRHLREEGEDSDSLSPLAGVRFWF